MARLDHQSGRRLRLPPGNAYAVLVISLTDPDIGPTSQPFTIAARTKRDYDGDGKTDLAVFWPEMGQWFIRASVTQSMLSGAPLQWGWNETVPIQPPRRLP